MQSHALLSSQQRELSPATDLVLKTESEDLVFLILSALQCTAENMKGVVSNCQKVSKMWCIRVDCIMLNAVWVSFYLGNMGKMMSELVQKKIEIVELDGNIVKIHGDESVTLMASFADKKASFKEIFQWTVLKTRQYMKFYKCYEEFQEKEIVMLNSQVKIMKYFYSMEYIKENLVMSFEGVLPTILEAMQNHKNDYIKRAGMSLTIDFVMIGMKLEASLCPKMTEVCLQSVQLYDKNEKMQQFGCTCLAIFAEESLATQNSEARSFSDCIHVVARVLETQHLFQTKLIAVNCLASLLRQYNHFVPVDIFEELFTAMYSQSNLLEKGNMVWDLKLFALKMLTKTIQCVEIMLSDSNASVREYRAELKKKIPSLMGKIQEPIECYHQFAECVLRVWHRRRDIYGKVFFL